MDGKPDRVNVPSEVREKIGLTNCMISNVTLSKMTDTRYIQKDYFIGKDQKRNDTVRNLDTKEWDALYEEVMRAVEADLVLTMVRKAQKVGLTMKRGEWLKLCSSLKEIGEYVKKDESIECATKINYVVNEGFQIRMGYDVYAENRVMEKLNLKYSDDEKPG